MENAVHVFGGSDAVVQVFQHCRQTDTKPEGESESQQDCLKAFRANRKRRNLGIVGHVNVVGSSGQDYVVFFGALQETVEQPLVRIYLLLDDVVIDRRFVLAQGSATLLVESGPQRFFPLECLMVAGLKEL